MQYQINHLPMGSMGRSGISPRLLGSASNCSISKNAGKPGKRYRLYRTNPQTLSASTSLTIFWHSNSVFSHKIGQLKVQSVGISSALAGDSKAIFSPTD